MIMKDNEYAPETYFIFSIINFVEMLLGTSLGVLGASSNNSFWMVAAIGHLAALLSITTSSIWIWCFYWSGVHE